MGRIPMGLVEGSTCSQNWSFPNVVDDDGLYTAQLCRNSHLAVNRVTFWRIQKQDDLIIAPGGDVSCSDNVQAECCEHILHVIG